jgi:DNA-directed RNA polymerase II subunit RPB1
MDYLYELYDILINKFAIKGIPNITEIDEVKEEYHITFDNLGKKIEEKEYVIYTSGINLNELKNYKVIDFTRTNCNDIQSNYKYYGLESAKKSIMREIEIVYADASQAMNYNHIELIADIMTTAASITSIDRHGIGRMDIEPLGKASFEKTFEQFVNAAIFNEVDHLKNVSSRIMVGKSILGGTGLCELLLDVDMVLNSEKGSQYQSETIVNYIKENILLKEINNRNIDELYIPFLDN